MDAKTAKKYDLDITPLDARFLSEPWADKTIYKDPKYWQGPSQVGKRFSEAPADFMRQYANLMMFKAQKGKEDAEPKLDKKGKPYWENDLFNARLAKAWYIAKRGGPKAASEPLEDMPDDEFP